MALKHVVDVIEVMFTATSARHLPCNKERGKEEVIEKERLSTDPADRRVHARINEKRQRPIFWILLYR